MKNLSINGKTNIYGIIGDPVDHSFSPIMHNTISNILNKNSIYIPFHVEKHELEKSIIGAHSLKIKGLNVTFPHKENVIKHLTYLDDSAKLVGSVNTLKYSEDGYVGYNTDYIGIDRAFKLHNINLENKNIVILGAGGSSYAAAITSAINKPKKIFIVNRTEENGQKLIKHVKNVYNINMEVLPPDDIQKIEQPEIVIQTTPVGFGSLKNFSPIIDDSFFLKILFAMDIIYSPWETKFLENAKSYSVKCTNGFDMLVYQGLASYEIWHNMKFSDDTSKEILKILKEKILDE